MEVSDVLESLVSSSRSWLFSLCSLMFADLPMLSAPIALYEVQTLLIIATALHCFFALTPLLWPIKRSFCLYVKASFDR